MAEDNEYEQTSYPFISSPYGDGSDREVDAGKTHGSVSRQLIEGI